MRMGSSTAQAYLMPPLPSAASSSPQTTTLTNFVYPYRLWPVASAGCSSFRRWKKPLLGIVSVGREVFATKSQASTHQDEDEDDDDDYRQDPTPEDLEYVSQIKRVLELLRKNRDMLFSEVKLTVMIEDPREVERKRLLGIEDSDAPTRDDLVAALEQVNEGRVPKNRVTLQMLAEEMMQWPNLEVEALKKTRSKSLYAKATDTGVDPQVAAKGLNIDWDSAAAIEEADASDETEVPKAVGYGALYLVTAFPIIIGIAVVLILFYNSLHLRHIVVFPATKMARPSAAYEADDIYMNRESSKFRTQPGASFVKGTLQIMLDPKSLKKLSPAGDVSPDLVSPPPVLTAPKATQQPPFMIPAKPKFWSFSVPNSAGSSPPFSSLLLKKKWRCLSQASARSASCHHRGAQSRLSSNLQRSKSCGAGRAYPFPDEFDLLANKTYNVDDGYAGSSNRHLGGFCDTQPAASKWEGGKNMDSCEKEFKCGALCLYLPGFGKGKPVRARKDESDKDKDMGNLVISRTVSLEKFECGSWSSSAIINACEEDGEFANLYFDLPMELIRGGIDDAQSPVTAAFVFDKDHQRKGVLRRGAARKLDEASPRHVRFSTSGRVSGPSSPSCITPRLRKARDEFNAFLEAQST